MPSKKNSHTKTTELNKYPVLQLRRDPESIHHYLNGEIRVLTPGEYQRIKNVIPQKRHRALFDTLIITGMRYVEVQRLWDHREWYLRKENMIHLSAEAQKKHKRSQQERTIHPLPGMFELLLDDFFEARKPPAESNWNRDLRKWAEDAGINPYGISAKSTRKTIESWMIKAGIMESTVCLRQGHDSLTSMRHYQGLAFTEDEIRDIKKQLTAWGILK
ncbi:tyrosine-type recombinase/integrase [Methanosarcina sp.]|uniref:tyrosine-type recombinase/integrase n=1 Tax=Methanosarcina sp. TaxID=2213 RepID=UPI003C78A374